MTMPSLISNYREKETVSKLKKAYSTLSNAYLLAVGKYGTMDNWEGLTRSGEPDNEEAVKGSIKFLNILAEQMKILYNCENKGGCFYSGTYKSLGTAYEGFGGNVNNFAKASIIDGMSIAVWINSNSSAMIYIDTNGKAKPNTTGKDAFWFCVNKNSVIPGGIDGCGASVDNCLSPVNTYYTARGCTAWVLYKENMDYLHCKGLNWNGADSCKKL